MTFANASSSIEKKKKQLKYILKSIFSLWIIIYTSTKVNLSNVFYVQIRRVDNYKNKIKAAKLKCELKLPYTRKIDNF